MLWDWDLQSQSEHYENGLLQCSNVDREKAREGRGQTEENVWVRRNDATKKYAMRAEGGARLIGFRPNLREALTMHFIAARQKVQREGAYSLFRPEALPSGQRIIISLSLSPWMVKR